MKNFLAVLSVAVVATAPLPSDEGVRVRYADSSSKLSLTLDQDIGMAERPSFAGRSFSFDLEVTANQAAGGVEVLKKAL